MRRFAVLACLAACGRFGFGDPPSTVDGPTGDADAAVDAKVVTGPLGARWIRTFTDDTSNAAIGTAGDVHLIARMSGSFTAEPNLSVMPVGYIATALIHYDATGAMLDSTVLDSDGFCDMRSITLDGPDLIVAGFTEGTNANTALGACSITTNRQDPIAIRVDPAGQQTLVAHWIAAGANAQGWRVAVMPDHSLTIDGIYAAALQVGTFALPAATSDPSTFIARTVVGMPTAAAWAQGFTAPVEIHAGPLRASGDDVCIMGAHNGATSVFGVALPYVGGYDTWVARLDPSGNPRFVRAIGSTGNEPSFGEGSLLANADGGCTVGIDSPADVVLDSMSFPVSAGRGLVVQFASDGSVASGRRVQSSPFFTRVGNRLLAAYTVTGTVMIGSTPYTADGTDVVVVEFGAGNNDTLLGVVGGSGQQVVTDLVTVGPDAVAISLTTQGPLTFGSSSSDSGATQLAAVGVLGI